MTIRKIAGLATALLMMAALVPLMAAPAWGNHIPATGSLPDNCVEFQANNTGSDSVGGVTVTLDSWDDVPGDPHSVTFTISGLAGNQYVDISVKSGNDVQEAGPYDNGTHTFENGLQNAISHIRLCVFESTTTTTTEESTTTTEEESTTTTEEESTTTTEQESTTTTEGSTTTTEESTTTTEEESTTTTEQETTTTTEEEVEGETTSTTEEEEVEEETTSTTEEETEDTLPFTGLGTDGIALAALVALASGAGLIFLTRGSTESEIDA